MKYFDVKLKDFQVAAIAALIALGYLLASPKNTAEAAGISMAAPALHDLARSAPDATIEKAYYHYYRRHYWHPYWHRRHYWRRPYYRHYYYHPYRRHY
jgi:hypothetical protein